MEQRGLKVIDSEKTFFSKLTTTITKLLIPTRVGLNGMMISMKRGTVLKQYESYIQNKRQEIPEKKESTEKRYEEAFALYLESIDKYIMDSIYKKVKNGKGTEFEKNALAQYYEITHLKERQYLEYKYKKQKYLLDLDYETVRQLEKEKLLKRYEEFYCDKMDVLYKGLLKHYSVQLADQLTAKEKQQVFQKIFDALEQYITDILPIKMQDSDQEQSDKEIMEQYNQFDRFSVGKLDQIDCIEKKMLLLGISRQLFTHSLPLVVAEQCYIKLLKDIRSLIIDTRIAKKRQAAYKMLLTLIEDYNIRLLSTKIYWDKPKQREEYKKFWNQYKQIQKRKEEEPEEYEKQREILFIQNDLKQLCASKKNYDKIIQFYKTRLVQLGVMRQLKKQAATREKIYKKIKEAQKKIG